MRVLHLAPPARRGEALTADSFIDEEIAGLADAGVDCVVLSAAVDRSERRGRIAVEPIGRRATVVERARAMAFTAQHHMWFVDRAMVEPASVLQAARIELAASAVVQRLGVDVIHSHCAWPAGFGGVAAAADAGIPLVASLRGMDLLRLDELDSGLRRDRLFYGALRHMLRRAAVTIYASKFMRDQGVGAGAAVDRARVIRKGVDLQKFHPADDARRASARLGVNGRIVLCAGSLIQRKGYDVVLEAMGMIDDLDWTLVICGEGPDRADLETAAALLGLRDRVRFIGSVDRDARSAWFSAADVFVYPGIVEAAGNVILEALASGCPVICTDAGAPCEYVEDGRTGFIVPVGDSKAIADRLHGLLTQPALRAVMALEARLAAETCFPYGRLIDAYRRVYEEAVCVSAHAEPVEVASQA